MNKPKILVYDIETAGVNAFNADLGYVISFAYILLDDFEKGKKFKVLSITDYKHYSIDPHDDKYLLKDILKIMSKATHIIHHYGNRFDEPFLRTRMAIKNIKMFPEVPQLDTCYLAWKKFKLSSNRLANIAKVFKCKYNKIDKKDGWPKWWMDYLKGGTKYVTKMSKYNGYDVMTLAEISIKMRPYWPRSFVNYSVYADNKSCKVCGSVKLHFKEFRIVSMMKYRLFKCGECGYSYNKQRVKEPSRGKIR